MHAAQLAEAHPVRVTQEVTSSVADLPFCRRRRPHPTAAPPRGTVLPRDDSYSSTSCQYTLPGTDALVINTHYYSLEHLNRKDVAVRQPARTSK